MALGARTGDIVWMIVREVLIIAGAGIALGIPVAWWLGRLVATQLYGVIPADPVAIGGAILLLTAVAVLAGLVPSMRAARVDPTRVLLV